MSDPNEKIDGRAAAAGFVLIGTFVWALVTGAALAWVALAAVGVGAYSIVTFLLRPWTR